MFIFIQEKSFCLAVIFRADHFFLSDCCFVNLGKFIPFFFLFFFFYPTSLPLLLFIFLLNSTKICAIIYRRRGGPRKISASL